MMPSVNYLLTALAYDSPEKIWRPQESKAAARPLQQSGQEALYSRIVPNVRHLEDEPLPLHKTGAPPNSH